YTVVNKRNHSEANHLPDEVGRRKERTTSELQRKRTDQSFCVPKAEIAEQDYDLSINRYKEIEYEEVEHRAPLDIIADVERLNAEIADGVAELKEMLQ